MDLLPAAPGPRAGDRHAYQRPGGRRADELDTPLTLAEPDRDQSGGWLGAAIFAFLACAVQRLLSKVALTDLGTRRFYLLSAAVSLFTYLPYLLLRPPAIAELPPAFGLACLMAITFGVTTQVIRRGQLGTASPITALSPARSAALGLAVLGERAAWPVYLGIALAPAGIILLSLAPGPTTGERGWLTLALLSLVLQGVGAFLAKLVVAPVGPSALLLLGAGVQVVVGLFLAPPWKWSRSDLRGRPALLTVIAYVIGAVATIGYLLALTQGPDEDDYDDVLALTALLRVEPMPRGYARLTAWLLLAGWQPSGKGMLRAQAEAMHLRRAGVASADRGGSPGLEDTLFSLVLLNLFFWAEPLVGPATLEMVGLPGDEPTAGRLRGWLVQLVEDHLTHQDHPRQ